MEINPLISSNKCGIFTMDKNVILYAPPHLLKDFLSQFIIVRAEVDFITDRVIYSAYSELFNETAVHIEPPTYDTQELFIRLYGKNILENEEQDDARNSVES